MSWTLHLPDELAAVEHRLRELRPIVDELRVARSRSMAAVAAALLGGTLAFLLGGPPALYLAFAWTASVFGAAGVVSAAWIAPPFRREFQTLCARRMWLIRVRQIEEAERRWFRRSGTAVRDWTRGGEA